MLDTLKILKAKGFVFILITNQGGMVFTDMEVAEIHTFEEVCEENDTPILDIYYSPITK